jgi:hypothetical protein
MARKWGPNRGRRECFHEVRTQLRTTKVEIRFDRNTGEFFSQLNGEEFKDASLKELEALLLEEAEKADNIDWERWVEYELHQGGHTSYVRYQDSSVPIVGIRFDCLDLSIPQKGIARRTRRRRVDDAGNVEPIQEDYLGEIYTQGRNKLIRFTPGRWVSFKKIESAIVGARKMLGQLLDADDAEDQLDSMTSPLLAAGQIQEDDDE